jgi:hypothetical protein
MIHTKRVIFMILPLLSVPLVYGISSTPDACAVPPDSRWEGGTCTDDEVTSTGVVTKKTCCWREKIPGSILGETYCQQCTYILGSGGTWVCDDKELQYLTTPPTTGESVLPGTAEQPPPPTPPPLFGRNEGAVPPTGGIEQPFTSTTPPLFGNIPQGGGFGVLQEPETPPTFGQVAPLVQKPTTETPTTPLPTPPPPDFAPQDNQDNGGLPTIKNQENVPPGGDVAEQPEDDGQEESSEGAPTAGPLT